MEKVKMITDGAARGNPDGPGGYGTIVRILSEDGKKLIKEEEFAEGFKVTSNNRMELLAVIIGLESLTEPSEVDITSDSKYVVDAFNQYWINNWVVNGWLTSTKKPVKNIDLWKRLLEAKKPHKVKFYWVKGHDGHADNERCDFLATSMADNVPLIKYTDGLFHTEEEIKELENPKDLLIDMKKDNDGNNIIVINGIEYSSIEDIPENLMKCVEEKLADFVSTMEDITKQNEEFYHTLNGLFDSIINPSEKR